MEKARSHPSVDWLAYFESIQQQCPWSLRAYQKGEIDIVDWLPGMTIKGLENYQARMYVVDYPNTVIEAMATELDGRDTECEWLWSYPGYGEFATPVAVLIQQNRQQLNDLRSRLSL